MVLLEYNAVEIGIGLHLGNYNEIAMYGSWRCNTRIPNELIVVFSRYVYTSDVNQKKQTNKTFVQLLKLHTNIVCAF